jgi:hypothetical protein
VTRIRAIATIVTCRAADSKEFERSVHLAPAAGGQLT